MEIPDTLAEKLETFRTRGEAMPASTELFKETNWFSVLMGQGFRPDDHHPVADVISEAELKTRLLKIRTAIQERVAGMPDHAQYLARTCAAPVRRPATV
jgi:tryptophan halogenase